MPDSPSSSPGSGDSAPDALLKPIHDRWEARKEYSLGFDPVDASRLLAAIGAVLELADRWDHCGLAFREAIRSSLAGDSSNEKEAGDGS